EVESGHQDDRLVGELQPLDMGEPVAAVSTDDAVGHGDDVVAEVERCAIIVDREDVIRRIAREAGGIEIELAVAGQDLAHDLQLAGVVGPVEHERNQGRHAVEAGDLLAGAVRVRPYADANVERPVAVDQVVAAIAFDDVAAIATEDDVAGAEGG